MSISRVIKLRNSAFLIAIIVTLFCPSHFIRSQEKGKSAKEPPLTITGYTDDPEYGYKQEKPINVGGGMWHGSANQEQYLKSLRGPNGETIKYKRLGSCCMFVTPNGIPNVGEDGKTVGIGLLDKYEVKYKKLKEPIILYLNVYDAAEVFIPVGFTTGS
jgi:hypothetical protein